VTISISQLVLQQIIRHLKVFILGDKSRSLAAQAYKAINEGSLVELRRHPMWDPLSPLSNPKVFREL